MGARGQRVALEGVTISDAALGTNPIGISFDIFEEIEFELGGHPAEVGMAPGAYVNIVTKSGGNEFHGSLIANYFNEDLIKSLIPETEAKAVGLTAPLGYKSSYDFSANIGGPVIKDKFWFFLNGRAYGYKLRAETIVDGVFDITHDEIYTFSKLSYQVFPNLKLTGMLSFRSYDEPIGERALSYYKSKLNQRYYNNVTNWVGLGMVNWILNQNTFFDVRFNYNKKYEPNRANPELGPLDRTVKDNYTGITTGPTGYNYDGIVWKYQLTASVNHFMDNFLGGNHEIKAGIEYEYAPTQHPFWREYPITQEYTYQGLPWGLHDALPYWSQFQAMTIGEKPDDWILDIRNKRYGAYLQDSFSIANRITLNFGIRYDETHGSVIGGNYKPSGAKNPILTMLAPNIFREYTLEDIKDVVVWKDLSPRFGIVFDVFGDRTTSISASISRYNDYLIMGHLTFLSPAHPQPFRALWHDIDKNGKMDTTDEFKVIYFPIDPFEFEVDDLLDPNFTSPINDEILFGIEREFFKNFSLKVSYIYKKKSRIVENIEKDRGNKPDSGWWVPITANDPGWDGVYGTSDDQQITVYGVKKGAPKSQLWQTNPPELEIKYQDLESVFEKRMSNRWQLLGSVTLSKLEGNREDDYDRAVGKSIAFDTPNWLINRYGRLQYDRPIIIKIQGSVMLPLEFIMSGYYSYYSGIPWGRTVRVQVPNDLTTFEYPGAFVETTIMTEPPGTRRYHARNNLDLRIEKTLKIADFGRLGIFLDVLNVFGEKGYEINQDLGGIIYADGRFQRWPNYGQFTGIYGLRTYKVSIRFKF